MTAFWTWGVRNPAIAAAVLALASGFAGVAGWSLALVTTTVTLVVADSAHHLASRARMRKRRRTMALEAQRAAQALREEYRSQHRPGARNAA